MCCNDDTYDTLSPLSRTLVIITMFFQTNEGDDVNLPYANSVGLNEQMQKGRKQGFTVHCMSTITVDLSILLRCDSGKGHAEME